MALRPTAWIDATIPGEILADPHQRVRARLVQSLFALASLGLIIAGVARYVNSGVVLASHIVPIAIFALGATLLKLTKSLRLAAVVVLSGGHLALVSNALELGGLVVVFTWDTVLLAGAVYILGPRAGVGIAALTIASALGIAQAQESGWITTPLVATPQFELAVMVINQLVVMMIFAGFYHLENRRLAERLEAARQQAEASNRAKSVFLATMSHEIRTPMNGVIASADLLRRGDLAEEERGLAEIVFTSGEALLSVLNDILDFSKIEAGEVELEAIPFSLAECASSVVHLQTARARAKNVALQLSIDPRVPDAVLGDGPRLRQVLHNLVSNAVKFTAQGHVRLEITMGDGGIAFAISDTGVGLSEEQRSRLFLPFSQADASVHRTHGGTGLGLAISQRLVQAMGGKIEVESAPGEGSTFRCEVALPAATLPAELRGPATESREIPNLDGVVLIVDDNQINRRVAEKMLGHLAVPTLAVDSGEAALRALESDAIALVLMDRQMPGLDGLETTRRIRALSGDLGATPIVGLTASAFAEEIAACVEAGMQEVLAKPVTLRALQDAVARWAKHS